MQRGICAGFFEHGLVIVADAQQIETPSVSTEFPPEVTCSNYAAVIPVTPDSEGFVIVEVLDPDEENEEREYDSWPRVERATVEVLFPSGKLVVVDSEHDWRMEHAVRPGWRTIRVLAERHLAPERVDLVVS